MSATRGRAWILGGLLAAILASGCTHVVTFPDHMVGQYPSSPEKLPMSVVLIVSEELRNAKWVRPAITPIGDTFVVPVGEQLALNSEALARRVFRTVSVRQGSDSGTVPAQEDALLIPKVIFLEQSAGVTAFSDAVYTVAVEWSLKTASGSIIWVDTVKGEGRTKDGNVFTMWDNMKERARLALDDLFLKSFRAMTTARPIQELAKQK